MPRDADVYLEDILQAIERIRGYLHGMDHEQFIGDSKTIDAVLHNLEIIGEAAKKVPPLLRQRASDIDWRRISGMRDLIAHAYFDVDLEIVWDVASNKLDDLAAGIRRLREKS